MNKQMRAGSTQNHAKKGVFFGMVQKSISDSTYYSYYTLLNEMVQKSIHLNYLKISGF
jgi:hypothetical protein